MEIALLVFLLLVGPLALLGGRDSRIDDRTGAGTTRDDSTSRLPATVASAVGGRGTIAIRRARPSDGPALARLEALAERRLPDARCSWPRSTASSSRPRPRPEAPSCPIRSG